MYSHLCRENLVCLWLLQQNRSGCLWSVDMGIDDDDDDDDDDGVDDDDDGVDDDDDDDDDGVDDDVDDDDGSVDIPPVQREFDMSNFLRALVITVELIGLFVWALIWV